MTNRIIKINSGLRLVTNIFPPPGLLYAPELSSGGNGKAPCLQSVMMRPRPTAFRRPHPNPPRKPLEVPSVVLSLAEREGQGPTFQSSLCLGASCHGHLLWSLGYFGKWKRVPRELILDFTLGGRGAGGGRGRQIFLYRRARVPFEKP